MSDEVKRLCNVIIGHVADGKTIFEKDHAAMIDTMRSQQAEIERLRDGYNAGVQDAAMIMQKRADQMMELGEDDMMVRYFGSAVQIQSLIKDEDQ